MMIPFALFLCVRNALFRMRLLFAVLTIFGILGLVFTFTRAYYITEAVQVVLAFLIMVRDRMLTRDEALLVVMLAVASLAAVSPKLYNQFIIRENSVSVRFLQYEAAAKMTRDHPVFGVGLNNDIVEKKKYNNATYNPYDADTQFDREPTNDLYLSLSSEIGVLGALLFMGFFYRVTLLAWRQSRHSTDPEIRLVASAFVVVFCGVSVIGLMDPVLEYQILVLLWLYAGIIINLPRMAEGQEIVDPRPGHRARYPRVDPHGVVVAGT